MKVRYEVDVFGRDNGCICLMRETEIPSFLPDGFEVAMAGEDELFVVNRSYWDDEKQLYYVFFRDITLSTGNVADENFSHSWYDRWTLAEGSTDSRWELAFLQGREKAKADRK